MNTDDDLAGCRRQSAISCVICAYNEADRISDVLSAVYGYPLIREIIVVDDGSSDNTAFVARSAVPGVKVVSYAANRGKTYALSRGIAAATGDLVMLIDADLRGLSTSDIIALAQPVLTGGADVTLSLRANSLALFRALGLDFVSGERVIPMTLIRPHLEEMTRLPRWAGEVFINDLIASQQLAIAVVDWPGVFNIRKAQKIGFWRGGLTELSMTADIFRMLSPVMVVRQNMAMLALSKPFDGRRPRKAWLQTKPAGTAKPIR